MNDIFQFHEQLTSRYNDFSQGFNIIREEDIKAVVHKFLNEQKKFCPEPLIQLNMNYEKGHNIHELVKNGSLHEYRSVWGMWRELWRGIACGNLKNNFRRISMSEV